MEKRSWLIAAAANAAPIGLCCLYACGAPLLFTLFPILHILLFRINRRAAQNWPQVVGLGLLHILTTFCTHCLFGWLYFERVADDAVGRFISALGCMVGTGFTVILLIVSMLIFRRRRAGQVRDEAER